LGLVAFRLVTLLLLPLLLLEETSMQVSDTTRACYGQEIHLFLGLFGRNFKRILIDPEGTESATGRGRQRKEEEGRGRKRKAEEGRGRQRIC